MTRLIAERMAAFRWAAPGLLIAALSGVHKFIIAVVPVNDDFMHLAFSRQLLAGEWPFRDFFDYGQAGMYGLSALGQIVFGYRLLPEALIDATAAAFSTFLVYSVVRRATGSLLAALVSALMVLVATPRGYAYPKLIVYSACAWLWWRYVWQPDRSKAIALGVLAAMSFYLRHDHGVYVAIGVALAMVAAHRFSWATFTRAALAGWVTLALLVPFLLLASLEGGGFPGFVRTELEAASYEHRDKHPGPTWPIRRLAEVFRIDDANAFAPIIGIRWKAGSSEADRRAFVERYGLSATTTDDPDTSRVRLSSHGVGHIRDLLAEPVVDDTAGIDRSRTVIEYAGWPPWDRLRFRVWLFRARLLPGLDTTVRAGEAAAILEYAICLVALAGAFLGLGRFLPPAIRPLPLVCFALFALVVSAALIRTPYETRVADNVILPSILLGLLVAVPVRMSGQVPRWGRWVLMAATLTLAVATVESLAAAGPFSERINWAAGDWTSMRRASGAWGEARRRLWTSPPVDFWRGRGAPVSIELARYARECVLPSERLLVLWFAPEIHYFSDRLMAGRHLYYMPALRGIAPERQMQMEKVARSAPPIVFANDDLEGQTRDAFPDLVDYLSREYEVGASFEEDGKRYRILVRHDRTPLRSYGEHDWPCYAPGSSPSP